MNDAISEVMWVKPDWYLVIDNEGQPAYGATWPEACHEHINDVLDVDETEAGTWKVVPVIRVGHPIPTARRGDV